MRRAALLVAAAVAFGVPGEPSPVAILYTNDLHLRFSRLESIERLIEETRGQEMPVFLFDAGDTWQDFRRPLPAVWGADEMVEWMNGVGYDAMALGNHDMYWGPRRLDELAGDARFPVLCANLRAVRDARMPFVSSTRVERNGITVFAIGLITRELLPYADYPTVRVVPAMIALRSEIDRASIADDLIVVVAHLPIAEATRISRGLPEIDVFITGHSHEATEEPVRVGETLIVQSGAFGANLGRLVVDVDPDSGRHRLISNALLPTQNAPTDLGRGVLQLSIVALGTIAVALLFLL